MTRSHPASARADVYSRITAEIVDAIEAGAGDWRMPWHHDGAATTRVFGNPYEPKRFLRVRAVKPLSP